MPNYTWNHMSMKASDYKKYVERIDEDGKTTVDFNVLIPMPKSYEGIASSTETDRSFVYYISDELKLSQAETMAKIKALLPNYPKWRYGGYVTTYMTLRKRPITDIRAALDLGKQVLENIKNYGAIDWYDWCCDNWSTKWNAFDVEVEDIDEESDICWFKFTTAWCPPERWIIELSKHCDFTLSCEVEGSDTGYRYVCENGVLRYFESDFVEKELKV